MRRQTAKLPADWIKRFVGGYIHGAVEELHRVPYLDDAAILVREAKAFIAKNKSALAKTVDVEYARVLGMMVYKTRNGRGNVEYVPSGDWDKSVADAFEHINKAACAAGPSKV